jgi:hypothetical protein
LTVIEPDAESRPVLVIPVLNLANIYGFQGPVRSTDAGDSGDPVSQNSTACGAPALSREKRRVRPSSVDMLGGRRALRPGGPLRC